MHRLLEWHRAGGVRLFASSRVFDPDTDRMHPEQRTQLRALFEGHHVEVVGTVFRLGVSRLGGPDLFSGPPTARSPEELRRFIEVVGADPATLSPSAIGATFARKVGDYDALHTHFGSGNEVFVTLDTKDYLRISRRPLYAAELGLIVQSPAELVAELAARLGV
jgi:hypothetical protein